MELGAIWINIILSGRVSTTFEMEHPDLHCYWSSRHKPVQKPNLVPLLQQTFKKEFQALKVINEKGKLQNFFGFGWDGINFLNST